MQNETTQTELLTQTELQARFYVEHGDFTLDVEFSIPSYGVTALFGRSGSGKTTILRCLAGLERLDGSRLRLGDEVWQDAERFVPVHQRALGYVFQEASLFPHLSVRGNLLYGYQRVATAERSVTFDETVALLGLENLLERYPDKLSGGQRQRVSIGRALLTSPRLLLMDEPLAALDDTSKAEILPWLERLHESLSIPLVYVSHSIDEVARLADHMLLLENGRVLAQGPLQEMLTRPDLPLARSGNASTVLNATLVDQDAQHHLSVLECGGERLLVSRQNASPGQRLRVRVTARDVAIALRPPAGSSVSNCLAAQVESISDDPQPCHVLVGLAFGDQKLIARIARHAHEQLGLTPGMPVYALVNIALSCSEASWRSSGLSHTPNCQHRKLSAPDILASY
ncbi:molybdenum ABC transporter ATP-binding protein [Halomonas sp. ZH2S]|uniref:Molybdenum ABC transporter ATP-binding protein n=1 Tax=Vreelandella zhuhanensis TaxID=2684210 RepID=A0A7X3GZQ2_9GAMM|nr:molybdenum ABC transporter ATP-binding protein [Halomonas zhuhanensis]MWJ26920.1 molybdenum ABC transporter ATP-binding protein [Halomonas zhuhanensis]